MAPTSLVMRRQHNASIAIAKLPAELLTEIFHLCIVDLFPGKETYMFLESLCEVCSAWYAVVCGAPKLWAYVASDWPLDKIHRSLRLSRNHLLDINEHNDAFEDFLPLVLPSSRRWRSAKILTPQADDASMVHLRDLDAPQLESLSLKETYSTDIVLNLRNTAPLHTLELDGRPTSRSSSVFVGLRKLVARGEEECFPLLKDLLVVLQSCPHLVYLDLGAWSLRPANPRVSIGEVRTPIVMHQLQTVLLDAPWDCMVKILELVRFPVLVKGSFNWNDMFSAPEISHSAHVGLMSSLVLAVIPPGPCQITINPGEYLFKFHAENREVTALTDLVFTENPDTSFIPFVQDFSEDLGERQAPWTRPYLYTTWDSDRDVALDYIFTFEEVAFVQYYWSPDAFSEFVAAMKVPLPGRDRWLFHAMDSLSVDYLEKFTPEMSS